MTDLREAIDFYHSLLDDSTARESQGQLNDQLHRRELFFGERPLCTVLRPRFLTTEQYHHLQRAIRSVMPAFAKAHQAALADPAFRAQFRLADWEEELIQADPGFRAPSPTARMDTFFTPHPRPLSPHAERGEGVSEDGLYFTEYNAETPAAPAYNDVLSEVFFGLSVMRAFERRYEVRPLPGRHHVLHALLDAYAQWGGRERPRIVILDWREVPTYSEFVLFQDYFRAQGYECLIADPREFEYRDGKLLADGITPVNLIYKRVLISELVARGGLDQAVVRAVRDGAVCMVNPFQCKILHKKASLAVLSDEANSRLFSADELRVIQTHIPWTRVAAERRTRYEGREVDLIPFLSQHKDDFVLKPNDEYGGKGIVLGWEASQSDWEAALKTALAEPYIVQKRVNLPSEPYPSLIEGNVKIFDRMLDTNPYIWYGDYVSCCLTRLSTAALLNVTAGGGSTVPTFVVEKRDA
ncbi:MAG TPA: circularly permuted type 2 ATP-grasp protein [Anaerolineales bacterium]|nr:circularly permuted type 2 ATP-grasp protein [Anaerolineales bacterium]